LLQGSLAHRVPGLGVVGVLGLGIRARRKLVACGEHRCQQEGKKNGGAKHVPMIVRAHDRVKRNLFVVQTIFVHPSAHERI
jgi:hypothetical protein